jgi:16S rRNA (cytosine967-C5)-methyltransferase
VLEVQRLASAAFTAVNSGRSLTAELAQLRQRHPALTTQQRAALTDLCYGTLRFGLRLGIVLDQLLQKPLRDEALRGLLLVALYQLEHTKAPGYAIVDNAVKCAAALGKPQAAGLVNAVLRNFLRKRDALLAKAQTSDEGKYAHPRWWVSKLRKDYPHHFERILAAADMHPPFTLRVNRRQLNRDAYLELLAQRTLNAVAVGANAVKLERAVGVEQLPGFGDGLVSVQDAGAQNAAPLLDVADGMRVLDACAAPGGKTTHILELADVNLTAIDQDAARLQHVNENLQRLRLNATVTAADVNDIHSWWNGEPFDRILADVPCSASGVVRRHPDIKWLRRESDVAGFVAQQRRLLDSLWRLLARGGKLLYTTCSIFQEENSLQIADFLERHADATRLPVRGIKTLDGIPDGQLLPDAEHDGFFYALLEKT